MIGWYVHDHGSGHRRRLEAVAAHLDEPVTGMGAGQPAAGVDWLPLPPDSGAGPATDPTAGGGLHWAPVGEPGMLGRADLLSTWVRESGCRLLVVDVSVEMLLLGRLLGLPTVAVLQPGRRDDHAHTLGYDSAAALLAPWPAAATGRTRTRWAERTTWTGGFSRFDGRAHEGADLGCGPGRCVALVLGRGGHGVTAADVRGAAAATAAAASSGAPGRPDSGRTWHWHVAGTLAGEQAVGRADVVEHGRLDDVWPLLCRADVVVGPSGGGLVSDVAAAGTPFLALPQSRPFDEQVELAGLLRRAKVAEVAWSWPTARAWPRLLHRLAARGRDSADRWLVWSDGRGAARAAEVVQRTAATAGPGPSRPDLGTAVPDGSLG